MTEPQALADFIDFAMYRLAVVAYHVRRSGYPLTKEQEARLRELAELVYTRAGEMVDVSGRVEFK
ncbi:MAG TPA: hypothetical protein VG389_13860 [Myxococcota bacterium]|jgi:hypothetical protein|nr:hypothetical protein [Myxococcota bacterium]